MRTSARLLAGLVMIFFASYPVMADAQSSQTPAITLSSVQGTVVSASTSTVVVKTGENQYQVFVVDRNTARPQAVPMHAQVTVRFVPVTGDQTPIADSVVVTAPPTPAVAALTGEAPPRWRRSSAGIRALAGELDQAADEEISSRHSRSDSARS